MSTSMGKLMGPTGATWEILDNSGTIEFALDGTSVTSTAAELNKLDGVASTAAEIDQRALSMELTLGTADTKYMVIPWTGSVTKAYTVTDAALTTADETITLENDASTAMTNGVITITQSGSAAGDIDEATPTANNTFTAGEMMEIIIGGENGSATSATLTVLVDIT